MEIAWLLDVPLCDGNSIRHKRQRSQVSEIPETLVTNLPKKRRHRPSAQQLQNKSKRDADNSHILNLMLDVNELRRQVHDCMLQKSLRETRLLFAREQFNARSLQAVERFFQLFKNGYSEMFTINDRRFFLREYFTRTSRSVEVFEVKKSSSSNGIDTNSS